jgi:LPS O-antigen subunit length determinant protein (WzzB/FepE family)
LKRDDYETDVDFDIAVVELAAEIAIQPPINEDGTEKGESRRHWTIEFEGTDKEKWLAALVDVTTNSTAKVRETLIERFNTAVEVAQQARAFKLEDLSTQMENAKSDFEKEMQEFELVQGFEMEDVQQAIRNARLDYDRKTKDRLAFLREQAAIARELGVAKNTLEAQTFSASNGVVANVKSDTPFYLRGYEAIEKEIALIVAREDKDAFITGLLELEQKQRTLEQDLTLERADRKETFLASLLELEKQQRAIQQDKTIERAQELFTKTPVSDAQQFVAAQYDVYATNIESKSKRSLIVALALVLGGMVGVMFVLIRSAVRNRKAKA